MQILKRNVAQVGERLMIALDKDWCRKNGIHKGAVLDVTMVDHGFLVMAPPSDASIFVCPTCHYSYCNCVCGKEI